MAEINYCDACDSLRQDAPDLVANGWDEQYCETMITNEGLGIGNDDCTDLHNMNDCLIGSMEDEAQITDQCDWRTYMGNFVRNLWTMLSAIICSICGIWEKLDDLQTQIENIDHEDDKTQCIIDFLTQGMELSISETDTGESYIVAGKGVSFLEVGSGAAASQVTFEYVAGGLVAVNGSCAFHQDDFTDEDNCWNYDLNGVDPRYTQARKGNPNFHNSTGTDNNLRGEMVYEIRISLTQYPQIKEIFNGIGSPTGAGAYHIQYIAVPAGQYANGQHGICDRNTGEPVQAGDDYGHLVPDGWVYVQARMASVSYLIANGNKYSPRGFMGIRFEEDEIVC